MRSSCSRTMGSWPRRVSAPAADKPDGPAPTPTISARSVRGMKAPEDEQVRREHEVEGDRNRAAEPALVGMAPHPQDVARGHRRGIKQREHDRTDAERRSWLDPEA